MRGMLTSIQSRICLSSRLLRKTLTIKIYKTMLYPLFCMVVEMVFCPKGRTGIKDVRKQGKVTAKSSLCLIN
jgi:hypothetical protein